MITDRDIEEWFSTIYVSEFDGIDASHVYKMAEIAYRKGIEDAVKQCEKRADSLPYDQCGIARQCAKDVKSML
jgi:hypothetical protein